MQPMRPRFQLTVDFSAEEVLARFHRRLACEGCPCQLTVLGQHLDVRIHERLRHFWSPQLSVEITPKEQGAELNGLFGPNPNVWTLFLACYAFLGLSASFAAMLGLSQLQVGGGDPWGLYLAGALTVALILPYTGSLIGQRLAADQMDMLRCFLRESIQLEHQSTPAGCAAEGLGPEAKAAGTSLPVV